MNKEYAFLIPMDA